MLLGLIGGVALAFFLEHLDDTIRMPEDMEQLTQLPVLGVVPKLSHPKSGEGRSLGSSRTMTCARRSPRPYRSVRTGAAVLDARRRAQVFMVTSTAQGEGKTTTALALAINSAQTGRPCC
jgi:Mrp family chromosome partitioning ATPase